jgi:hypothetical protein
MRAFDFSDCGGVARFLGLSAATTILCLTLVAGGFSVDLLASGDGFRDAAAVFGFLFVMGMLFFALPAFAIAAILGGPVWVMVWRYFMAQGEPAQRTAVYAGAAAALCGGILPWFALGLWGGALDGLFWFVCAGALSSGLVAPLLAFLMFRGTPRTSLKRKVELQ